MKLAKILHSRGFYVTFVNTEYNDKRLIRSQGPDFVKGFQDFQFETIPEGLPPSDRDVTQDPASLCDSIRKNYLTPFRDLLSKLISSPIIPPISCIISDGILSFAIKAAQEFGILDVQFWTASACGYMGYLQYDELRRREIIPFKDHDLKEFAWGLANSKHPFLWIVRPGIVMGDSAVLPDEFLEEIKDRGLLASWCPQDQVLSHPSIGVFLTHCGWNSTIESISSGVPLICWPFFAEQQTNCRYACAEWGIGVEVNKDVKRQEIEAIIKDMLEGKKGKELKDKALEWKKKAAEATDIGGPSWKHFDTFLERLLLNRE
ncbi:hypothetical protein MTR67_013131 [Solanum verrucosum]|uniref:UDP-glycosyltransferases domain-containing protein n=1 Tax=Solanum verrucosum TaxID=315347 RepID=A0AAF0THM9_SOLVR|nr:hypothetical protein MTR67_013131 [Solanum verrucosum]